MNAWVFVGDPSNKEWNDPWSTENIRLGKYFPPPADKALRAIVRRMMDGTYPSWFYIRPSGWSWCIAKVTLEQLRRLVDEVYTPEWYLKYKSVENAYQTMDSLRRLLRLLDPNGAWKLSAVEPMDLGNRGPLALRARGVAH